jgi:hypothetical protein
MSNQITPRRLAFALLALPLAAAPLQGQSEVGHDPEHSPYHDLRATHQFTFSAGYLAGGGGRIGIGPRQGPLFGVRYSLNLGAVELRLGVHGANLQRHIVDPTAPADKRDAGVTRQQVFISDAGFSLRLTGAKTWHGLMPYFGGSLGVAAGSSVLQDNSGFTFSTRFMWGPHLGIRYYPGSSVGFGMGPGLAPGLPAALLPARHRGPARAGHRHRPGQRMGPQPVADDRLQSDRAVTGQR